MLNWFISTCFTGTKALTSEEDLEVGEVFMQMDLNHDGVLSKQVYLIYYYVSRRQHTCT